MISSSCRISSAPSASEKSRQISRSCRASDRIPRLNLISTAISKLSDWDEMLDVPLRRVIETKFDIDLTGRPTMYTVRGFVGERDGDIHTDSRSKLITVLLYMNEGWEADGGRLRILRSGTSLENPVAEVAPDGGTLLIFRRSDSSWHGHKRHNGPRRAIQADLATSQKVVEREQGRHGFSSKVKRLTSAFLRR